MPEKPQNNDSKKQSEISSSDSPRSDLGDGIDDLELEPISSQLPRNNAAESIPSKPAPAERSELTDDQIDDISLEDIDVDRTISSSNKADSKEISDDMRKPTRRMYPSGKEVDLTTKTEENPTTTEPENNKKEPPITSEKTDEPSLPNDIEDLIIAPPTETSEHGDAEDFSSIYNDAETEDDFIQESDDNEDDEPTIKRSENFSAKKKINMTLVEKGALSIFLLLLITGVAIYVPQMIPEGQISNVIVDVADTPIELEDITIETLEGRWTETINIASRVRRNVKWTPELEIAISGTGSGALRFIFLDQDGRQRGDTMDIAFANGMFQPSMQSSTKIYCTHGFSSELELKDLRARGNAWWTVRVLKGQDLKAPSSEFESIIEMKIPFEIVVSK